MDKEWKIKIGGLKESANDFDKLKKSVDDSKDSLNSQNKTVGDYSKAIREASKEIKNIQGEMLGLEKGSKAWTDLAKKAGEYKDRIDDIREATRRYASDTKGLDDVINLAQSATAAFTLYKGAMASFGVETENAEKALTELAGAMSIIQSLQTLNNTLKGSSATASLFNTVMKATGVELVQTQLAAIKATAAQEGLSTAQKAGAVASKTLGLALKAIPLMFIIGLVATLITHWEDLVGWFEDTFPALKKMGGAMNTLKGVIVGVGKAVVHWLINPFETFAKVIKKIMAGDFSGAVEEAVNGVKNQFTGLGKAFKDGFQDQVERGMEDMSRKAAAEMDKTLTHQKNMITKQKNADGTYRKEYIAANKKMFDNRKKMYKKDSDEYRKVLEDEAAFNQQIEDAKEAASKKASAERAKAAKAAAEFLAQTEDYGFLVNWDLMTSNEQKLEAIMTQKWLGYYLIDPLEAWSEIRRTDVPALSSYVARMTDDVLQFTEAPRPVVILDKAGKPLRADDPHRFFEASWMHKYNGKYYFSYSTGDSHYLCYAIGDNPYGPFTYQGVILEPVVGWTTHHCIVEFKGQWYLLYHDCVPSNDITHLRSLKVQRLFYNEDGTIKTVVNE